MEQNNRPEEILQEVIEKLHLESKNLMRYCKVLVEPGATMPVGFPQPWERRVFIGTNYDTHSHMVPEIKEAVIRKGYTPVIAYEASIPPDLIHHHSLMLLHTCKYAIFDITAPAGQYMEIERAQDYGCTVLLVRSALDSAKIPPHISSMIKTLGYKISFYKDLHELKQKVSDFLP